MRCIKLALPIFGLLFFTGCQENFPTYSKFCNQENLSPPECLHYAVLNKEDKDVLEKHFGIADDPKCAYRVELTKYHV